MASKANDKLCVFGSFDDTELYQRNRVLIGALARNFETTVEVRPSNRSLDASGHKRKSSAGGVAHALWKSLAGFWSLARQRRTLRSSSVFFIPYPAYLDLFFLQFLTLVQARPRIIVDAFLCLHDTLVDDRRLLGRGSLAARFVRWLEARTLRGADLVFIDTAQQRHKLVAAYGLDPSKIVVTPVGIDESVWTPLPPLPVTDKFRLLFWGTFIPLHGVGTIVRAARILGHTHPDIEFMLIGDGQTGEVVAAQLAGLGLTNLDWRRTLVSGAELRTAVEKSHCILGVFGESAKAGDVVPYKAYQAMASNKVLITREGPAMSDLLGADVHAAGIYLVPAGDPDGLARQIVDVYENYASICGELQTRQLYAGKMSNAVINDTIAGYLGAI